MKRRRILLGGSELLPGFITQHPSPNTATYDGQEHELCTAGSGSGTMLYSKDGVSFSSSIPTEINAGTYTVYYKTDASHSYTESDVYQISCTIGKAAGSVSIAPTNKSVTYNGTAQDIINAGSGTGAMYYRVGDSGDFSTTIPKQTNASNSYTVYYYAAESSNYAQSSTGSVTATIGQKEVTLTWGTASWTYDKTAHSTTCTAGSLISGDSCTVNLTGNSITNVGSTTVTASSLSNSNYKLPSANTKSISVGARTVTLTWGTVTWTYDKSAHSTTCTAGNLCSGDTCTVTLTGNSITNKGTTTVTASSLSNSNYALPSSKTNTLTINARTVTLSWGTVTWTYDGKTHSTTCTAGNVCSGDSCTVTLSGNSVGANAGTATVTASSLSNSNYTLPSSKTATLTINKATGSASVSGVSLTFNNSSRNLVTVSGNTGTMHYRVGTSGSWTTTIPTSTNVGSWTIYYYMDASTNYTAIGSSSSPWSYVSSSIGKANQSAPTATGETTTYPTTATATASGGGGIGTLTWTNGNSQTSVGSKKTKAYWAGNGNYNASPYSNEVTVQMNKAAGSVSTAPTAKNPGYTGSAQALVNAGSGTGTMYYRLGTSGNFSTNIPTATDIGSYTVQYYAAASTNYNQSATGSVSASIAMAEGFCPPSISLSYSQTQSNWQPNVSFFVDKNKLVYYWQAHVTDGTIPQKIRFVSNNIQFSFVSGTKLFNNNMPVLLQQGELIRGTEYANHFYEYKNSGNEMVFTVNFPHTYNVNKGTGVYSCTIPLQLNSSHVGKSLTVYLTLTVT